MSAFEDGVKAERDRCIAVVDEAQKAAMPGNLSRINDEDQAGFRGACMYIKALIRSGTANENPPVPQTNAGGNEKIQGGEL